MLPDIIKQETARQMMQDLWGVYKTQRLIYETQWETWYKHYLSIPCRKFYQGRANLFPPETFNAVETKVASLVQGLIPTQDFFALRPRQSEDVVQADLNTELIKYELERTAFKTQLIKMMRQAAIYGTIVINVHWDKTNEYRKRKSWIDTPIMNVFRQVIGMKQTLKETLESQTVFEGPRFEVVPLKDFYCDARKSIDDAQGIFRTQEATFVQLKMWESQGIYFDVDRIKDEEYYNAAEEIDHLSAVRGVAELRSDHTKKIHLLHYWGKYKLGAQTIPCVITLANAKYIIRISENKLECQRIPYLSTQFIPVEDEFYGVGIPELLELLQVELNDTRNQIMDSKTFNLCRMWKRRKGVGILTSQLKISPNGVIDVEEMGDLEPIEINNTAEVSGYNAERVIKEDIRNTSSTLANQQGLPTKYKTSATEIRAMASGSDIRNRLQTEWLEETLIKPVIERIYNYNQQFITKEMAWSILGPNQAPQFMKIRPEQIGRMFDVVPLGSSIVESRAVQQQQLINFANIAFKVPQQIVKLNYPEIVRRLWEGFGFRNAKEIVMTADPAQALTMMLEEMVRQGMPPEQAFAQLQQMTMKVIGQAQNQLQQGQAGAGTMGKNIGLPPQEQPQPLTEVDASRNAGEIRGR